MKKLIPVLLLTIFCFVTAKAEYRYIGICTMLRNSDYGAMGTIIKVDDNYFYLKVDKYVLNKLEKDTLAIVKFENWSCARRYVPYKEGQKELVFFSKSNYVIDDYEFIGYGAGDEYELLINKDTIKYQCSFGKVESIDLNSFLTAVADYSNLSGDTKGPSKVIYSNDSTGISEVKRFPKTDDKKVADLHMRFLNCISDKELYDTEPPENLKIINLNVERNYLYQDYENKIFVGNYCSDSVKITSEDAEIWREGNYFIIKPQKGWTRRWVYAYSINSTDNKKRLFEQLFEVLELPKPEIYFGMYNALNDTIYYGEVATSLPSVGHYLDKYHKDENLKYELLSYDYIIQSADRSDTFRIKSRFLTHELKHRLRELKTGDKITMSNIFVLYPDKKARKINNKTVTIVRNENDR